MHYKDILKINVKCRVKKNQSERISCFLFFMLSWLSLWRRHCSSLLYGEDKADMQGGTRGSSVRILEVATPTMGQAINAEGAAAAIPAFIPTSFIVAVKKDADSSCAARSQGVKAWRGLICAGKKTRNSCGMVSFSSCSYYYPMMKTKRCLTSNSG